MMHDRQTLLAEQAFLTARLAEMPAGALDHAPELINQHLYEPVSVSIMHTRVNNGRPRYTLLALPWVAQVTEGG